MNIKRGNIIYADLGQHPSERDSRQSGVRPCLVVSNEKSWILHVIPCTKKSDKKFNPVHVKLMPSDVKGYSMKESIILVEQTVPIDRRLVKGKIGYVKNQDVMRQVDHALKVQFDLVEEEQGDDATKQKNRM